MSEEKRTKIGTGTIKAVSAATPAPTAPQDLSKATEFMDPSAAPTASTASSATPAAATHQTSYLPPAAPTADPLLGQTLAGRYLIQKKLGEGGMGAVYLASHLLLEKSVALKVLHNEFSRKPDLVERFIQEAKAASRIRHENVIDISDFGSTPDGVVFFAMELLKGHDLHEEVARARIAGQLLPFSRSKKIFLQICAALSAAHARGIVHRDLKPENIYLVDFLGEPDFVKLLDFGIAKLTEVNEEKEGRKLTKTGMLFGTPEYMSPEQARGEPVDHRVDVYAMGCILFQLVTGRVPFEAENFMGVLSLHLTEQPPEIPPIVFERIGAPPEIAQVIDRALHKDRDQRWQTIDDLANAVRQVCGDPIIDAASRSTASQTAVRASVQAPEKTTQARVTPPPMAPQTSPGEMRQRTQWTGSLSVPTEDSARPRAKSKLPLILGGLLVVGIAAGAVFFATRGGGKSEEPGPGTGGSQLVNKPPPTPDANTKAPPPPQLPEYAEISLDTDPPGADIIDVSTNKSRGPTPQVFRVAGSSAPRQFELKKKGYKSLLIELVPNKEKLAPFKETLVKGTGSTTVVVAPPPSGVGSNKPPTGGSAVPDKGSGSAIVAVPVPVLVDAGVKVPIPDPTDCDEPGACIKTNIPGMKKCTKKDDCPTGLDCTDGICK
ncbi:MAG: serine/threonine protein kinase [Deltaproteobacteria bacterium]|nr:serine/threonine protein kinase [Deltaproteobacteria bacterium]